MRAFMTLNIPKDDLTSKKPLKKFTVALQIRKKKTVNVLHIV